MMYAESLHNFLCRLSRIFLDSDEKLLKKNTILANPLKKDHFLQVFYYFIGLEFTQFTRHLHNFADHSAELWLSDKVRGT